MRNLGFARPRLPFLAALFAALLLALLAIALRAGHGGPERVDAALPSACDNLVLAARVEPEAAGSGSGYVTGAGEFVDDPALARRETLHALADACATELAKGE